MIIFVVNFPKNWFPESMAFKTFAQAKRVKEKLNVTKEIKVMYLEDNDDRIPFLDEQEIKKMTDNDLIEQVMKNVREIAKLTDNDFLEQAINHLQDDSEFTIEQRIFHAAYERLICAQREIYKIKDMDSDCSKWCDSITNICLEMQDRIEGSDDE